MESSEDVLHPWLYLEVIRRESSAACAMDLAIPDGIVASFNLMKERFYQIEELGYRVVALVTSPFNTVHLADSSWHTDKPSTDEERLAMRRTGRYGKLMGVDLYFNTGILPGTVRLFAAKGTQP